MRHFFQSGAVRECFRTIETCIFIVNTVPIINISFHLRFSALDPRGWGPPVLLPVSVAILPMISEWKSPLHVLSQPGFVILSYEFDGTQAFRLYLAGVGMETLFSSVIMAEPWEKRQRSGWGRQFSHRAICGSVWLLDLIPWVQIQRHTESFPVTLEPEVLHPC